MSVLIKGMEMPSSCNDCLFGHWSNLYQAVFCELLNFKDYPADYTGYKAKRLDKCPLVDVPTPHGALIDRDALRNAVYRHLCIKGEENLLPAEKSVFGNIIKAPAIIEAEGEND